MTKPSSRRLNEIIFPYIIRAIEAELARLRAEGHHYIVLDAPTLFESGCDRYCDVIISVVADEQLQLRRILGRDGLTHEEAEARIQAQHRESYYVAPVGLCH